MKRQLSTIIFFLIVIWWHGQDLDFFKVFDNDSIIFYYYEPRKFCSKSNSQYYRITRIDTNNLTFISKTKDFTINNVYYKNSSRLNGTFLSNY